MPTCRSEPSLHGLRSGILGGAFPPGERLPPLHRLAEQARVNVNTIRAVY